MRWKNWAILGIVSALLVVAIIGWSRTPAPDPLPSPPAVDRARPVELAPPEVDPAERERRRFDRYDRDEDGLVAREEYLHSRRRSFERMDADAGGNIDFDEYSVEQRGRFGASDCDASAALTRDEFASTATRKDAPEPEC